MMQCIRRTDESQEFIKRSKVNKCICLRNDESHTMYRKRLLSYWHTMYENVYMYKKGRMSCHVPERMKVLPCTSYVKDHAMYMKGQRA